MDMCLHWAIARYLVMGLDLALYHLVSDQLDNSMYLDVTVIYQARES